MRTVRRFMVCCGVTFPNRSWQRVQKHRRFELSGMHIVAAAGHDPGVLAGTIPVLAGREENHDWPVYRRLLHDVAEHTSTNRSAPWRRTDAATSPTIAAGVADRIELYGLKAWRGKGVGRRLMDELDRIARERGCSRVEFTTDTGNLHAQAFYTSLGFQPHTGKIFYRQEL